MQLKTKKFLSFILVLTLLTSVFSLMPVKSAAAQENTSSRNYALASSVQNGNILHCCNWYYNTITANLQTIAEQGFTSIQVSPVQDNKKSINSGAYFCDWSFFYQVLNFEVGNELGDAEDFRNLCTQADKYGIKIIVDIVANHMAQGNDGRSGSLSDQLEAPFNSEEYFHNKKRDAADTSRQNQVLYNVGGLPDLDTSNPTVQKWVYDLLNQCVTLGADGFRFDTAKHIETSNDGANSSDFWENTAVKIKSEHPELYMYGEVIDLKGTTSITNYTDIMNVTDAGYGIKARSAIHKGTVANLSVNAGEYDISEIPLGKAVIWAESHDEFYSGVTSSMSEKTLVKTYAALASRKDSPTLFFTRPACNKAPGALNWDSLFGECTDTWKSTAIREVNLFKNAYEDKEEALSSYDNTYYLVHRGDDGLCIVNAGDERVINLPTTLNDGKYKDWVSGSTFTVSNGYILGKMDSCGVAVLYDKQAVPSVRVSTDGKVLKSLDNINFTSESEVVTLSLRNAEKGTYKVAGNEAVEFTGSVELTLGSNVSCGYSIPLTVTATSGDRTTSETYRFNKKDSSENITVFFDAPTQAFYTKGEDNPNSAGIPHLYAKNSNGDELSQYPGFAMEAVESTKYGHLYKYTLNVSNATVKFNDGTPFDVNEDAHTIPPTEAVFGDAALNENRVQGGYEVCGSVLWHKNMLIDVHSDGTPYSDWEDACDVSAEKQIDDTDSSVTVTQEVVIKKLYGDAFTDNTVNMQDVTTIQKHIAQLLTLNEISAKLADVDNSSDIQMADVVLIQKFMAKLITAFPNGNECEIKTVIEITTDPDSTDTEEETDSEDSDDSSTDTSSDTDAERVIYFKNTLNWSEVYAHYWENLGAAANEWPGEELTLVEDDLYMLEIPEGINANRIIFNNGGNKVQTANIHLEGFGMTFEPTQSIGRDTYGNLLYTGTWDGEEATFDP